MSKPRRELNPQLTKGDRVMCLHMDGETGIPPGTLGTVRNAQLKTRLNLIAEIINVNWDNGSVLWVYYHCNG